MGYNPNSGQTGKISPQTDTKQMEDQFMNRAGKVFRSAYPLYQQETGQALEALKTGGINAQIPIIQRAVEANKLATSNAMAGSQADLRSAGLAGTPFAERTMSGIRTQGDLQGSQIPAQYASQFIGAAPGLSQQGFGASNAFGNTSLGAQQLDLERQIQNQQEFAKFMEDIKSTLQGAGSAAAACCHRETLVATPNGLIPIHLLRVGDPVCSLDGRGDELVERVKLRSVIPIAPGHVFARVGADSLISPSHPLPNGEPVGERYTSRTTKDTLATYDIAVTGVTGAYFVGLDRVAMGSTLDFRHRRGKAA